MITSTQGNVVQVQVSNFASKGLCISTTSAQFLFDKILPILRNGTRVDLSFEGVEVLISAFLNVAIGQLYGVLSEDTVDSLVSYSKLSNHNQSLVDCVVDNAKVYFRRSVSFDEAWKEWEDENDVS